MVHLGSFNGGNTFRSVDEIAGLAADEEIDFGDCGDCGLGADLLVLTSSVIPNGGTFGTYVDSVAVNDARIEKGSNTAETLARVLATGWIPIYCSNSTKVRDAVKSNLMNIGWYGKDWSGSGSYGVTVNVNAAPADVLSAAERLCGDSGNIIAGLKMIQSAKEYWGDCTLGGTEYNAIVASCKVHASKIAALVKCASPVMATMPSGSEGAIVQASSGAMDKPFYKKWWFWTSLLTVGVIGTAGLLIWRRKRKPAGPTAFYG